MSSSVMIPLNNISSKIEILYDDQNQPWFKRAHVGSYLEITHINTSVKNLDKSEMCTRDNFEPTSRSTAGWSGPKDQQNKTDIFLSVYCVMHVIVGSRKSKGKELKHHILTDVIPRGFNAIIAEKQQAIEERDNQLQAITYQNQFLVHDRTLLHNEIHNLVRNRHVPRSGDIDNILCVVEKNNPDEIGKPGRHPYYMIKSQKKALSKHLNILRDKYPNMIVKEPECDDPNAVHCWNRFKTDILTKQNYYRNHFSLAEEVQELFEDMFDVDM